MFTSTKNPQAKLTKEQKLEVKALISQGIPGHEIAKQYGVTPSTISQVKRGKLWKTI